MKKILIFSVAIAMLVCAGCGTTSNTTQKNKSTVATTETTEEVVYKDPITYTEYETLDALTADFPEKQPGVTQYLPPQSVLDSWEFRLGRIDNTYYNYTFYDAEQERTIFLEIGTTTHYNNMQERQDELSQYSTIEYETIVQDEFWRIDYYPDNEDRTLYGIMPDSGADYALMIWRDDGEKDTQNDLMTVRETLGI